MNILRFSDLGKIFLVPFVAAFSLGNWKYKVCIFLPSLLSALFVTPSLEFCLIALCVYIVVFWTFVCTYMWGNRLHDDYYNFDNFGFRTRMIVYYRLVFFIYVILVLIAIPQFCFYEFYTPVGSWIFVVGFSFFITDTVSLTHPFYDGGRNEIVVRSVFWDLLWMLCQFCEMFYQVRELDNLFSIVYFIWWILILVFLKYELFVFQLQHRMLDMPVVLP
jgi:hypothetical protein